MSEFVRECRSEWKRLGVPDAIADEMAAELGADLAEAEAEGAAAEDVLGRGVLDPRSFAAAWAAERGVIQRTPPSRQDYPSRARTAAAIGAFALIAFTGAALAIVFSSGGPVRLALATSDDPRLAADSSQAVGLVVPPPPAEMRTTVDGRWLPTGRVLVVPPAALGRPAPANRIVAVDVDDSAPYARAVGWVLLAVGLAGVAFLAMLWSWGVPPRRSRLHVHM